MKDFEDLALNKTSSSMLGESDDFEKSVPGHSHALGVWSFWTRAPLHQSTCPYF
jgi:hypothetical protein